MLTNIRWYAQGSLCTVWSEKKYTKFNAPSFCNR